MGASCLHTSTKAVYKFVVLQAPSRDGKEAGWRLRDKAFENKVGTQAFYEINDKIYVFIGGEEMEIGGFFLIFLCHTGTLDELELMELERGEGKSGKDAGFCKNGFHTLTGESKNEMSACADAPSGGAGDGIDSLGMGVTTVDTRQRRVIDGLDAVFDDEESAMIEVGKIIEEVVGHTVGTSAYDEAYHIGDGEGFFVFGFEILERIIGVGVCLKVSEVLHVGVFAREELLALFQLSGDGLGGDAIVRVEGLVVAIGAASRAHPSITIGAGETSIEGDFLHLHTQLLFQPNSIFIV